MTVKRVITSDIGKDVAKQILKQVDDIVTKGKAKQNPENAESASSKIITCEPKKVKSNNKKVISRRAKIQNY